MTYRSKFCTSEDTAHTTDIRVY